MLKKRRYQMFWLSGRESSELSKVNDLRFEFSTVFDNDQSKVYLILIKIIIEFILIYSIFRISN